MINNLEFIVYGAIIGGATVAVVFSYIIFRKARAHSAKHRPEVMNKINDFLGTQDTKHSN